MNEVNICGIPHKVEVVEDKFESSSQGMIVYNPAKILINAELTKELKTRTLIHEILHGILAYMGYNDLSSDEVFVCGLSNAIDEAFNLKEVPQWGSTGEKNLKEP